MKKYYVLKKCLAHSWRGFRILEAGSSLFLVCMEGKTALLRHTEDEAEEPFEARGWDLLPIKAESALKGWERLALGIR